MKFDFGKDDGDYSDKRVIADDVDLKDANLVTSRIEGTNLHRVVLDIDMDAALVPSSTPGHHHLYINKSLDWTAYTKLLRALVDAGIVQRGYAEASISRGYSAVRPPWVHKPPPPSPIELARRYLQRAGDHAVLMMRLDEHVEAQHGIAMWLGRAMDVLGIKEPR